MFPKFAPVHLFYAPNITANTYQLSEPESKHAIRVLRLTEGSTLTLMDGRGTFHHCEIIAAHPKRCTVSITHTESFEPRPYSLHIGIAPTKNIARLEWFLEKATEIGIEAITPIICQRSERQQLKAERLEKVILSAAKQSQSAWLPILHPPQTYNNFIAQPLDGERLIAHCLSDGSRTELSSAYKRGENVVILIGPEGDFTPEEIEAAQAANFQPVSLGQTRLRTETAGMVACHSIALLNAL